MTQLIHLKLLLRSCPDETYRCSIRKTHLKSYLFEEIDFFKSDRPFLISFGSEQRRFLPELMETGFSPDRSRRFLRQNDELVADITENSPENPLLVVVYDDGK